MYTFKALSSVFYKMWSKKYIKITRELQMEYRNKRKKTSKTLLLSLYDMVIEPTIKNYSWKLQVFKILRVVFLSRDVYFFLVGDTQEGVYVQQNINNIQLVEAYL